MAKATLEDLVQNVAAGKISPVYLVSGDAVLAEPPARRLAEALAERAGCEVEIHRRPARLVDLLQDLRTYSLFGSGKVRLVVEAAVLADKSAAADLVDQAADALPVDDSATELAGEHRAGASRLLQALHVFGVDGRSGDPAALIEALPKWAFQGGGAYRKRRPRGRTAKEVATLKKGLATLLEAARASGLEGFAEGDLAELGEVIRKGLPNGHFLVLVEHSVAAEHPLVETLTAAGAVLAAGKLVAVRGEWKGLDELAVELARETSVKIAPAALQELARRTLRQTGDWSLRQVDVDSTARFAAEYRKLATLAGDGQITRHQVEEAVEDRGEEDVWKILDALGGGRGGEALARYQRLLSASDDAMAARLSFFALLAGFCRQLTAVAGVARVLGVPSGVSNYNQFKTRWAPKLQSEVPGADNPLAGLHPFRLHRAYLAASGFDRAALGKLPWRILETEMRIKGESSEADVAISQLMGHVAASIAGSGRKER